MMTSTLLIRCGTLTIYSAVCQYYESEADANEAVARWRGYLEQSDKTVRWGNITVGTVDSVELAWLSSGMLGVHVYFETDFEAEGHTLIPILLRTGSTDGSVCQHWRLRLSGNPTCRAERVL